MEKSSKATIQDDFDATIVKSRFGFITEQNDNTIPSLIFTVEENGSYPFEVGFRADNRWQIVDSGRRLEGPNVMTHFKAHSMMGCLMMRVFKDLNVQMSDRGGPTDANIWVGLQFHWKIKEIDLGKGYPGDKSEIVVHLMPVKFLGGHQNRDEDQEFRKLVEDTNAMLEKLGHQPTIDPGDILIAINNVRL